MAWCDLHYWSQPLLKQTAAYVLLPESEEPGPYPVLYLLHGLSDDHTIWMRRTSIERYVSSLPIVVVMPDGGRGFYVDAVDGCAYDSALAIDLVSLIERTFPVRAERGGRAVAGLSMGGYGAVRMALAHPERFCAAVSHSGALAVGRERLDGEDALASELRRIFGSEPAGGPNDLFALASRVAPELRPALRIDCGVDDFLIEHNRAFHAHLEALGFPHEYEEFPGEHEWGYWDERVREAIAFVCAEMAAPRDQRAPEP
ncbi:MAG TPA: alpha/beta hydrolase family protein [Chthonomonadales bacterium]|nr:alpha/beta hydrolase family protein [Chthonomonadales bacterium]